MVEGWVVALGGPGELLLESDKVAMVAALGKGKRDHRPAHAAACAQSEDAFLQIRTYMNEYVVGAEQGGGALALEHLYGHATRTAARAGKARRRHCPRLAKARAER
jgi:hypothetical protein